MYDEAMEPKRHSMLDAAAVDPRTTWRAAPTFAGLTAALGELRSTGRFAYENSGDAAALEAAAAEALGEVDAALGSLPALRRFLGLMLIARESRLRRERGGRPRRRRG
jgi:hypothetical protein